MAESSDWFTYDYTGEDWTNMPLTAGEVSARVNEDFLVNLMNTGLISESAAKRIIDLTWDNV